MASPKKVHVVPVTTSTGAKKFVAKIEGSDKPVTRPATQAKTAERAIPVARKLESSVVIHRPNGQIRDADSYGDESKARDTKH